MNIPAPVGAIVLALLFRGCLLTWSFFVLPDLQSPCGPVENRGTNICISALKNSTTSQNFVFLKLHDDDEIFG